MKRRNVETSKGQDLKDSKTQRLEAAKPRHPFRCFDVSTFRRFSYHPPMPGLVLLLFTAAILVVVVLTIVVIYGATHPVRRSGAYAAVRGLPFDPGDLDLKYEAWTLDAPGVPGARLPVWALELEPREDGKRFTAVFVHGWGESRIDMLKDIEDWRGIVGRAVLYDLRGHGESSPEPSQLGNGEDEDLIALLGQLGDDERFLIAGRELGANIAIAAAATESESRRRIAGVIAIAPYDDFHARLKERLRARDHPTWPMSALAMMWFAHTGRRPLVASEDDAARLGCPILRLDDWDEERVRAFVQMLR
jgi:pimeloyl-ACP methyl ester carboxylesterase